MATAAALHSAFSFRASVVVIGIVLVLSESETDPILFFFSQRALLAWDPRSLPQDGGRRGRLALPLAEAVAFVEVLVFPLVGLDPVYSLA